MSQRPRSDDDLEAAIVAELDRLRGQGVSFVKSERLARELDGYEDCKTDRELVGRCLRELAERRDDVHRWDSGARQMTFDISGGDRQ
jgi:hypothetical protein